MSFGASARVPHQKPKTFGLDASRTASNEGAKALPWMVGTRRLALTYLCPPFGLKTQKVSNSGKGKAGGGKAWRYFSGIAGAVCLGPVDAITEIWMNDERVWSGTVTRSGDYATITITGRGIMRIYWGTETQSTDATLATTSLAHPPYRGMCYVVFPSLVLGINNTSFPNIEVTVRRVPAPGWLTAAANLSGDANPAAVVADLVTHPRCGLAWSSGRLDTTTLAALGTSCETDSLGLSPVVDRPASVRQTLVQLAEHLGAWPRVGPDGLFTLVLERPASLVGTPLLTLDDLLDEPTVRGGSWEAVTTQTRVSYANRERGYQDDVATWRDPGARAALGEDAVTTLQRPWITRGGLARTLAAAAGAGAAVPSWSATLRVRRDRVASVRPGDVIRLTHSRLGLTAAAVRVRSMSLPAPGGLSVTLEVEEERAHLFTSSATGSDDAVPTPDDLSAAEVISQMLYELPAGLSSPRSLVTTRAANGTTTRTPGAVPITLAPLVVRGDIYATAFSLHQRVTPSSYRQVGRGDAFASHARLLADYPAETLPIDDGPGMLVEFDGPDNVLESVTLDEALEDQVVMIIGEEIMSCYLAEVVGVNQYRVKPIRGRYDTARESHLAENTPSVLDHSPLGTARVTKAGHGLRTGQRIATYGSSDPRWNATRTVTRIDAATFTFAVDPAADIFPTVLPKWRTPVWFVDGDELLRWSGAGWREARVVGAKLQPVVEGYEYDLGTVAVTEATLTGRALRPTAPINLRRTATVAGTLGDQVTGLYAASGGLATICLRWEYTTPLITDFFARWRKVTGTWEDGADYEVNAVVEYASRYYVCIADHTAATGNSPVSAGWQSYWQYLPQPVPGASMELWTSGFGTLKKTLALAAGKVSYCFTTASLNTWFAGTPTAFDVRLYATLSGRRSTRFAQISMVKI